MALQEFSLEGKVAIVTGAGRGIGKGIALTLAEAGADIVAVARTASEVEQTAAEVRQLGRRCIAIPADVTKSGQVGRMVERAISEFGRIDILVNNAGTFIRKPLVPMPEVSTGESGVPFASGDLMSEEEWHRVIDTNLTGIFLCTRAVGPHMLRQRKGKVINISSVRAVNAGGEGLRAGYCASKAGVNLFTKNMALEWGRYNINVNAIGPGEIRTVMNEWYLQDEEHTRQRLGAIPLRRIGEVREVGLLAVYLASDASDYVTGETIYIDGGLLA